MNRPYSILASIKIGPGILSVMQGLIIVLVLPGWIYPFTLNAQEEGDYDEIAIMLNVQRVGNYEISGMIRDDEVFLSVTEIFEILKIRNMVSNGMDTISGFYIHPQTPFLIDYPNHKVQLGEVITELPLGSMIRTETNLYLHSRYFGQIFSLNCTFNFRSLGVILDTKLDLPVIKEMRLEQMRAGINRLKGEIKSDTTLPRTFPWFHFGMADWSYISNQSSAGRNDTRLNLTLGSVIAGGEANISLLYNYDQPFREKQQQYLWRYANNDLRYLRQVMAGKIATQATSSIYAPVVGIQVTNAPTSFRRSFGTYTLSDRTEPGWTVELYVNNVLIDYVKADASGFFSFEVPMVYGNTSVLLKFYGPWGEERSKEQNLSIPFHFLPPGELQYTAGAGIVEDSLNSRFSRAQFNYGLSNRVTVGAGTEYLSSVASGAMMPFVSGSVRLASSLLLSGEYTRGVRSKGILTYRFPSNMQFEIYYTHYEKNQKAINYNYLQERKAVISVPIRTRSFSAFSRLTYNQIILPESKYSTSELLLSGAIYGISTNLTTFAMFVDPIHPYIYSNLSLSCRLPASFVFIPQAQYEYNNRKLISLKFGLEKRLFKHGFMNVSYENNFRSRIQNIELGFRYDFSFAQTAFTARRFNNGTQITHSARGSLIYDRKTGYLHAGNRPMAGRGGIVILPFLDLNCNGKRDADEPRVYGLKFNVNGGRIEANNKDTTFRIFDLEPYSSHYIIFDRNSFDNISWQIKHRIVSVPVDPNRFRQVEVPISVFGEASGMVYLQEGRNQKGIGRIIVNFFDESGKPAGRTLTEADGYFNYLGFPPGKYTARLDTNQMKRINKYSDSYEIEFEIHKSYEGEIIDDLEFNILQKQGTPQRKEEKGLSMPDIRSGDKGNQTKEKSAGTLDVKAIKKESSELRPSEPLVGLKVTESEEPFDNSGVSIPSREIIKSENDNQVIKHRKEGYAIQVGAFSKSGNADQVRQRLVDALAKEVIIREEKQLFKVMVIGFDNLSDAKLFLPKVKARGFEQVVIIKL